jgi:hypothetical protein
MVIVMMLLLSGVGIAFLLYVLVQLRLDEKRLRRYSADSRAGEGNSSEPRRFYIVKARPSHSRSHGGPPLVTGAPRKLVGSGLVNGVRRQKE